jgi:hypothetical protein
MDLGDAYNPVKFVLMTWIGPNVSPGLGKGRCAAHRLELYEFINVHLFHFISFDFSSFCFVLFRFAFNTFKSHFDVGVLGFIRVLFPSRESSNPLIETTSISKQLQQSEVFL